MWRWEGSFISCHDDKDLQEIVCCVDHTIVLDSKEMNRELFFPSCLRSTFYLFSPVNDNLINVWSSPRFRFGSSIL